MSDPAIQRIAMFVMRPRIGSCKSTMARLSGHLEQDLPEREERRVSRHLLRCHRCRAMFESLARAVDQVRTLGRQDSDQPMPSVAVPVVQRIRHERT